MIKKNSRINLNRKQRLYMLTLPRIRPNSVHFQVKIHSKFPKIKSFKNKLARLIFYILGFMDCFYVYIYFKRRANYAKLKMVYNIYASAKKTPQVGTVMP